MQCSGQIKLYNSLKKHGWENHVHEIIEECEENKLDEREKYWKQYYVDLFGRDKMLFLMLEDGKGGHKSNETKIKLSVSRSRNNKEIKAYDLKGNLVGVFGSSAEVRKVLSKEDFKLSTGDILKVCRRKKQKSCGGYIFQFSDDDEIEELLKEVKDNVKLKQRIIYQYDLEDNFIQEFPNSYQASKELATNGIKINSGDMRACCEGRQKTAGGFKWKYVGGS